MISVRFGEILRFVFIYITALSVLIFNVGSLVLGGEKTAFKTAKTETVFINKNDVFEEKKEEKPIEETKEESEKESQIKETTETAEVSAEAVKGKVIERYISPYNSGLSYSNVNLKNSTGLNINLKDFLEGEIGFNIEKNSEPQVLIIHTHTTETYLLEDTGYYTEDYTSRTTDNSKNMAKIGDIVAEKLNAAGINTIHDTTQHDYPKYSGSYTRSAKTVNNYLKEYKSIKIVLDLHRDAISDGGSDKVKVVTEIGGKKAAQVMLVMGSNSGTVTNYPNWKENLKLAVKLQQIIETDYPTLARPINLMSKNYNQSLSSGALLIEFGTDANTLEEASYSAEMVGESLIKLFNNLG